MPAIAKYITKRSNLNDLYWFEIIGSDRQYEVLTPVCPLKVSRSEIITIEELRDRIQELRPDLKHYFSNISDADANIFLEILGYNPLSLISTVIYEYSDVESMISAYNTICFNLGLSKKSDLISLLTSTNNVCSDEFYDLEKNRLYGISILER